MRMNATQATANLDAREERQNGDNTYKAINRFMVKEKESKRVIPLFKRAEDAEFFSVHKVKMLSKNGKEYTIDVDCLGVDCPLCKEAQKYKDVKYPAIPQVSRKSDALIMQLITVTLNDKGEYDFEYNPWERYSTFYKNTLYPFYARYAGTKMLEIERVDKKTYNLYEARSDEKGNPYPEFDIEKIKKDLNIEPTDIYGRSDSLVKTWSKSQMESYVLNPGVYPPFERTEAPQEEKEVEVANPITPQEKPAVEAHTAPEVPSTGRTRAKYDF